MLSNEDLLTLFVSLNTPLNGRKVVETIRKLPPTRRVGGGTHNVLTRFASRKMGFVVQAESHKCELPFLYDWEHNPNTHEFYDQPLQVKLCYRNATGKQVSHYSTPDCFLIQQDWMGWVECKPEDELRKSFESGSERFVPDPQGGWRCPPGEAFAAQYGLGFRVCASSQINWILVRNLVFLSDYLHADAPVPTPETYLAATKHFEGCRWQTLQSLLERDGIQADAIFALIAYQFLIVDLETELLAEPGFTQVCVDELSAEIYQQQKQAQNSGLIPLQGVRLASGTALLWDGTPWHILNVGQTDVFLEDDAQAITNLSLERFLEFVACGAITGIASQEDDRRTHANEVIKHAAPCDLEAGVERGRWLDAADHGAVDIPERTLRAWRKRAREGELAYGNRFVGLISRVSARGNRSRKIDAAVIEVLNETIDSQVLTGTQALISVCYGHFRNTCQERGLIPVSDKTFRAEIKRRREQQVALVRRGRRAAYALTDFCWTLDQSTPRHGERPFEIGHIDHTELDVQLVDSRSGANLGRPWLTLLIDAYTRLILAFFLTFDSPSYRSCMAVIRHAIRRHGRTPQTIVVDQGADLESLYFEALLALLGTHKKSRPAAKSRFGSVIERFFGISNQAFLHNLAGNNQALQKPRSMSPSHDPRKLAVWTLPALTDAFEHFVDDIYANQPHSTLGVSPKEAMSRGLALSGLREHTLIPYSEDFLRLTMPTTPSGKAIVRPGRGIKIKGIYYYHPVFREPHVERRSVAVRYDPDDASRALALVDGEWVTCRSEFQAMFERRSEREIAAISKEIRANRQNAERRRGVRAQEIATFLSQTQATEAVLRQQRRDAERAAEDPLPPPPPVALPNAEPVQPENVWSGLVLPQNFEELK